MSIEKGDKDLVKLVWKGKKEVYLSKVKIKNLGK